LVSSQQTHPAGPIYTSTPRFLFVSSIATDLAAFSKAYEEFELHLEISNSLANPERRAVDLTIRWQDVRHFPGVRSIALDHSASVGHSFVYSFGSFLEVSGVANIRFSEEGRINNRLRNHT
jgi:DNA-binding transcriptional LysR family regulator